MAENSNKIKLIFIGTPDFAIPALLSIINHPDFEIIAVITQPDKKVGRKQTLTFPSVKTTAIKHNLLVWQPIKIREIVNNIAAIKPDVIVVAAYAQIIPELILSIPKFGCINIHGSLLPKYRGASCVQAAIISGDNETGITIMKMDKNLDTGPILKQSSIKIINNDTAGTVSIKLAELGGQMIAQTIKSYINSDIKPIQQDDKQSTYAPTLKKNDGIINWLKTAPEIERFVRAMLPWPGAWTTWQNKKIAIKKIHSINIETTAQVGQVFIYEYAPAIQCGHGLIVFDLIQLEGRKEATGKDFLCGYKNFIGSNIFTN